MDPYAPPSSTLNAVLEQKPALRELVLAWERLRIFYNALLLLPGLLILFTLVTEENIGFIEALLMGFAVAVGANCCFFLGPASELYLRGLFRKGEPIGRGRWLIFGSGTMLSLMLFILFLGQLKTGWP
ncbi:hypothetical protein [Luteolibacter luteus]|uniref:Uncharacterized protein n=1 Tax=Luteolibacter luteus TaxID=2728835 RepID=A0A858RHG1_9BACT|nr:hypothetical protein [Luteolibacter luteus]QJE96145.1 hypothetical protein HHL09_10220 [Luteolibacter luteus]